MDYKKRCKDCAYLIEDKNKNWACDIDGKKCKNIKYCNAVEELDSVINGELR